MSERSIDLNADLGESFGAWSMGADTQLLEVVSSCNIACGFHAGDPLTMQRTVDTALANGVAIGAHPSLPDLVGFGRREMQVSAPELSALVLYQIAALSGFVRAAGGRLRHAKAHGALYAMVNRDAELAAAFTAAVLRADRALLVYGPPRGALRSSCDAQGIAYVGEGFADRGYCEDGSLVPRARAGALLDPVAARTQGFALARGQEIDTADGRRIRPEIGSVCVHGDSVHALELARSLRTDLLAAGLTIRAP